MQPQDQSTETKQNDKEINFRMLEAKYERLLAQERQAKDEALKLANERTNKQNAPDDDEDDSEPYVDRKKLNRELNKFGQQNRQETQSEIQKAVGMALQEERKQNWIKQNGDFYDVLQQHADKFAAHDPELAETILAMPEGFERQKLVYKNIKALGLHKEKPREPSIQDKIDANRRSPYYQPSSVGTAPYSSQGDFSPSGQKNAFDQMQALKSRLRL